jgi:hypothetical protein
VARDLGVTRREGDCIEAGRRALGDYATAFGGAAAVVRDWTVAAGDLEGRGYDAIVLCAFSDGGRTRGTLAIHAPREDAGRIVAADRLTDLWRLHAARLDEAYLAELGYKRYDW